MPLSQAKVDYIRNLDPEADIPYIDDLIDGKALPHMIETCQYPKCNMVFVPALAGFKDDLTGGIYTGWIEAQGLGPAIFGHTCYFQV
jgi:hypothetical protein